VSTAKQSHQNDEIEQTNDDILCCICAVETGDGNELIQCIQCRSLFHCQCHEPLLRCPPRSTTRMCNSVRLNNVENKNIENTDHTNIEG
jgi:hypothetical protein